MYLRYTSLKCLQTKTGNGVRKGSMQMFCFRPYRKSLESSFRLFFYLVLLHVSAYSYHNSFFILATSDYEHINISIGKFSVFEWAHNLENTFLSNSVLFAKWFRGAKIRCKDKNLFLFEEECSNYGLSFGKIIFRC